MVLFLAYALPTSTIQLGYGELTIRIPLQRTTRCSEGISNPMQSFSPDRAFSLAKTHVLQVHFAHIAITLRRFAGRLAIAFLLLYAQG
jgi:hypothetical protein